MDNRPIGIFDSGVGGLTVVKQIIQALPKEDIIYFGDTARVPYGSKTRETVTKFSSQIIRFLLSKNVKAVIIACNTVSSNSYEDLIKEFDIPIIEVVTPGVEACLESTKNGIIGVIGTESTIRSGAYENKLYEKYSKIKIKVYSKACPLFVPLAEEGWTDNPVSRITSEIYLRELIMKKIDTLVLGCTHYPLLKNCIRKTVGEKVTIVDPAMATAQRTREYLEIYDMLGKNEGKATFYVSDNTEKFSIICKAILGKDCTAEKIDIDKY